MLKILIVDDHAIVRKGLKQIVDNIPETVTVDEASQFIRYFVLTFLRPIVNPA